MLSMIYNKRLLILNEISTYQLFRYVQFLKQNEFCPLSNDACSKIDDWLYVGICQILESLTTEGRLYDVMK